ncbi:MAG: P-II family nitrogen regulator [Myxococcota bacterium]|nr:P-II family nitrogen regulator [Myxococcota bacterium]
MKLIRILVHPFDVQNTVDSLAHNGFRGMTLDEVFCDGTGLSPGLLKARVSIQVGIHEERLKRAVEAVELAGCRAEAQVHVEPLLQAVRIRTGEIDEAAL